MSNMNENIKNKDDDMEIKKRKERERKKAYRSKLSSDLKAEMNKKNRERYYRKKCLKTYALTNGISDDEVNMRIKKGDLVYNIETNEWLMNHKSRTINVEMTIETYNKYKIWMRNGCPTSKVAIDESNIYEKNTLFEDVKQKKLFLSNDNDDHDENHTENNADDDVANQYSNLAINASEDVDVEMYPNTKDTSDILDNSDEKTLSEDTQDPKVLFCNDTNDFEDKNVARGGCGLAVDSSDDDDDEICNVLKPMKGNVIEDDIDSDGNAPHEMFDNGNDMTTSSTNDKNEDTYRKDLEADLLFYQNNKEDYVWDGRYGLGRKYKGKRAILRRKPKKVIKSQSLDTKIGGNNNDISNLPKEKAHSERNTNDNEGSIVQKFIPVIITKQVYKKLPRSMWTSYATIPMGEKVMVTEYKELYEPVIYVCDVNEIKIKAKDDVMLCVSYNSNEAGKKRASFELPMKDATWLKGLGRQKQSGGLIYSTRKRKPTYRYSDEAHFTEEYKKMIKDHEKTIVTIKENNVEKKILLTDICKQLYDKINQQGENSKPVIYEEGYLGKLGGYLNENDVINTLARYCLNDPECEKYQIGTRKKLKLRQNTSTANDIVFLLLREYVWLFFPTEIITQSDDSVMNSKTQGNWVCQMWLGEMCDPEYQCKTCMKGIIGKNVEKKLTTHMDYGLFACENINKGEYIVQYQGRILKRKPRIINDYIIEVHCVNKTKQKTKIYVDTKHSSSLAKYCNHGCDNNAQIAKVFKSENEIDELWIKAIKDIARNDEIFVHYGLDFLDKLNNVGGCKCTKCQNHS